MSFPLWYVIKVYFQFSAIHCLIQKERFVQLAFEAHHGQKRRSGEPFIIHPVAVARILGELVSCVCGYGFTWWLVGKLNNYFCTCIGIGLGVYCCWITTWHSRGYKFHYFWKDRRRVWCNCASHRRRGDQGLPMCVCYNIFSILEPFIEKEHHTSCAMKFIIYKSLFSLLGVKTGEVKV